MSKQLMKTLAQFLCILLFVASAWAGGDDDKQKKQDQKEIDIGVKALADVEKEAKICKDPAIIARIQKIGDALAPIARTDKVPAMYGFDHLSEFKYEFRVIEDDDVNAFSLPGGFIFLNTGLIKFAESDDELAGVLAHEIAHAAHHHMLKLSSDADKALRESLLGGLLAAILSGGGAQNNANLITGVQLYQTARTNAYTQEAESDADHTGFQYLLKSGYNPVGMLTFMERLSAKQQLQPAIDWGIYRTHPPTGLRAKNIYRYLAEAKIPVHRSAVSTSLRAQAKIVKDGDKEYQVIYVGNQAIVRMPAGADPAKMARAEAELDRINAALDSEPERYELTWDPSGFVSVRDNKIVELTSDDAKAADTTLATFTQRTYNAFRLVVSQLQMVRSLAMRDN